ncbi:MAG: hypothetical protein AAAC47_16950, partial [Pararhizobium sp.]
ALWPGTSASLLRFSKKRRKAMTHHIDNRQTQRNARPTYEVASHCKKNGIDKSETRKIVQMLGRFASRHELEVNARPRKPKFRY